MKFSCDKNILNEAVNTVQKAVSTRSNVPVLEGILINATDGVIKLTGNDLDLAIESEINATVTEIGSVVINARIFGEIIRKLSDDIVYIQSNDEYNIKINCGNAEFELNGIPAFKFPEIPPVDATDIFNIADNVLKSMIKQTLFAVGTNENKVILTGSLFEIKEGVLSIVSVDGYRLALRSEAINTEIEDTSFVIPAKALSEVLKILKDDEKLINIGVSENKVQFEINNYRIVIRLLEGEFLNYQQIIPRENKLTVKANVKNLSEGLERAALVIENENTKYPVKLNIKTDKINISCISKIGKMFDTLKVITNGEDLEIGFNYRYLLDVFKNCEVENVLMKFNTALSPCIIKPIENNSFTYLVLPVRMNDE